jgi:hypothetical protein
MTHEDKDSRKEIVVDLDDHKSKHDSSSMRRRIDREVIRMEQEHNDEKPQEEDALDRDIEDDVEAEVEEYNGEANSEEQTKRRPKSLVDHIITGSLLTDGTVPYYRYFIAIAVMCFLSIFLTFLSLNTSNEYRRKERLVTTLHERSVVKDEQRYGLSSKSSITERLKQYNIELVDLSRDSRLIEK